MSPPRSKPPAGSNGNGEDEPAQRRVWQPPAPATNPRVRLPPNAPAQPATAPLKPLSGTNATPSATPNARQVPPPASVRKRPEVNPEVNLEAAPATPSKTRPKVNPATNSMMHFEASPATRRPVHPEIHPVVPPELHADARPGSGFLHPSRRKPLRRPALISRGERTLFWALLAAVLAMSIFLVRYRNRIDAHFQERALAVPLVTAAAGSSPTPLLLYLADDGTGALTERPLAFPLPEDPNTRARVVLEKLLSEYTAPGSLHPLKALSPGLEGVDEVFLAPLPGHRPGQLAVVDLTPGFIHAHPSGIEPETLTLLSMIATLHANLPTITEVRFLVDGAPRATLAGHADLSRTYLAGSAQMAPSEAFTTKVAQP